jgi:hypothetical protein
MGFAWMPDKSAGGFGDLYRDNQRVSRQRYSKSGVRAATGRHALSHSQRRLLASFGAASGAGRGAHAARLPEMPRRASGRSGPERWRRWA